MSLKQLHIHSAVSCQFDKVAKVCRITYSKSQCNCNQLVFKALASGLIAVFRIEKLTRNLEMSMDNTIKIT